jgi:hypothetical protein
VKYFGDQSTLFVWQGVNPGLLGRRGRHRPREIRYSPDPREADPFRRFLPEFLIVAGFAVIIERFNGTTER